MPAPQCELDNTSEYIDKNMDKLHDVLEILAKDLKDKDASKSQYSPHPAPQENFKTKTSVPIPTTKAFSPQQVKPAVTTTKGFPQTSMAGSQPNMAMNLRHQIPAQVPPVQLQQTMPNMYMGSQQQQQTSPMMKGQPVRMQSTYVPQPQQVNASCLSPTTPTSNQVIILPPNTMSQPILSPTPGIVNGHGMVNHTSPGIVQSTPGLVPSPGIMKPAVTTNQPITTNSFVIVNNANANTSMPVPIPAGGTSQQPNTIIIVAPQQPIPAPKQEKAKLREIRPKIPGNEKGGQTNGVRPTGKIQAKPQPNPQMNMQRRGNFIVFKNVILK
jgi:hypothetical protein